MAIATRIDRVNILLVDDQPSKLLTYQAILGSLGENLLRAGSATEALDTLLKNEVAVVLVDVCMPELNGYELASMIRQHPRFQKTSIILVSAVLLNEPDRIRGYECGAVDYMPVPVIPEILRAKVSVFADLYRKTCALERLNAELEQRVSERTAALEATTTALQEADRRKDEFLAMLAHELRNPLAPIRTAGQLLRLKELSEDQRGRAREIIERQVEHLVRLIDDLLDVSRITRSMITLHREPVLVAAVVAGAVETARPMIDARGHQLTLDLPDELLTIDGDKTRLVQVVGNVLHNAAKFTDPGGRIGLKASREGGQVVITVTDTGIGISPEQVPRIFDLFTQVHTQSESTQGGLGIGLALVKRLTEMHGGSVWATSGGIGRGTEIGLRLPVLTPVRGIEARDTLPAMTVPAIATRRILVADDNRDAVEAMATLLRLRGHDVHTAHGGLEALAIGDQVEPEIVLLDLGMPHMDGYTTAREMRLRSWGRTALIVALTGWGQLEDRQRAAVAGFDLHLVKPVSDVDLFKALSAADRDSGTGDRAAGSADA